VDPIKLSLAATNPESPIAVYRKEREFTIAFDVEDIVAEIARLQKEGFIVLNEIKKRR
jgi:methylmalonyl-CoA/ethylmalonyl-CoA epimerase